MTWLGGNRMFQRFAGALSKQLPVRAVQCMVWSFMLATVSLSTVCWAALTSRIVGLLRRGAGLHKEGRFQRGRNSAKERNPGRRE